MTETVAKSICMITHDEPYIDRRILLQAKCLIENGYQVSIISPLGEVSDDFLEVGIEYLPIATVRNVKNFISTLKASVREFVPSKYYVILKKLYFQFFSNETIDYELELKEKAAIKKYDIYVAHDLPALPIAHYAAKQHGAVLVFDAHEFYTGQVAVQGRRKRFYEQLEASLLTDVDLMFTVNQDIANLFTEFYGMQNIEILYNAMEAVKVNHVVDLHAHLEIDQDKKIVLYQGGFLEDRNLELLVEASYYLPDDIVLVMLGYSFLEKKLKRQAEKSGAFGKKVIFMERVSQKKLLSYTAGADFGIIPYPDIDLNTRFCTPNKMFEFLTADVPMIANASLVTVGHFFERYGFGKTITFSDPVSVANGIAESVKNMDTVKVKAHLRQAQGELSWQVQEEVLLRAYSKIGKNKICAE